MPQRSELVEFGWKRSQLSGVTRSARPEPPAEAPSDFRSSLFKASGAAFDAVIDDLAGLDLTLLLADRTGRLIHTVGDANSRTRIEVQKRGLVAGADLSEDKVGFNGIGTALEIGRGITIDGNEHFVEAFRNFSCFGVPIVHAGSKRLEGVLNVTAPNAATGSLLEGFGRTLVRQIEKELLENTYHDEYRLMEEFIRISRGSSVAVCALGEGTMMSNDKADSILELIDITALRSVVRETVENGQCHRAMEISRGRVLDLDIVAVDAGQAVVTLHPRWQDSRSILRGGPQLDRLGFVWGSRLSRAKGQSGIVAVVGEAGTGRTSAAFEILRDTSPERIEGIDVLTQGPEHLVEMVADSSQDGLKPLIIDDIEVLSKRHLGVLRQLLSRSTARTIVLTSTPPDDDDMLVASVLATADRTISLPPLRERTAEFSAIAQGVIQQLRGARRVALTPACLQTLSHAEWPGNLSQLKKTLAQVMEHHPSSTVGQSDLPPQFRQGNNPAMTAIEKSERTTILKALETSGSNKYQAAKALGISRTTLYRRLREYRIDA